MKIEWNQEKEIITVGKAEFTCFTQFNNSSAFASYVLWKNGYDNHSVYNTKERNKEVSDILKCSRSVLFSHFNKLQAKVFVAPIYDILKKVSKFTNGKGWDHTVIRAVNKNKKMLERVYKDNLYNLLPLCTHFGKSPQELKMEYKNGWKIVSQNSLTKNKALVKYIRGFVSGKTEDVLKLNFPTTLLAYKTSPNVLTYLTKNFKGFWGNRKVMREEIILFLDTERMAEQLGHKVNPQWSKRRLKEEHDSYFKALNAKKYSKDIFEWLEQHPIKEFEYGGYKATLIDNAFCMAQEGSDMGHCVAAYASSVGRGEYLVYSISKDGEKVSTAGFNVYKLEGKPDRYNLQQHYGRFNAGVESESEKKLISDLEVALNVKDKLEG